VNQTDQNLNENKLYVIVIFLTKQHSGEAEGKSRTCNRVLSSEFADESLECDHSNESY